jgi:DNA (cytosine-5)-methyltransferase 1
VSQRLRLAGLFAGIGGFELGFSKIADPVLLCEKDEVALAVLRARFSHRYPRLRFHEDVRDLARLPRDIDVLCAGFPCQDLSSAGEKRGICGVSSSLVKHVFRLLEHRTVTWVVLENVRFMLHLDGGAGIARVTTQLSRLGYTWAYRVIDTRSFGLPQRRLRLYLVASRGFDPRPVLFGRNRSAPEDRSDVSAGIGFYWTEGRYASGLVEGSVPAIKAGSTIGIPSPPAILLPDGTVGTPHIEDAERLQGFRPGWTRPGESVARASLRWRLVGNAVTVHAARWIANRIGEVPFDSLAVSTRRFARNDPWPEAAWGRAREQWAVETGPYPVRWSSPGLHRFLKHPLRPLSLAATRGFVKRASEGNLGFPRGFLKALRRHAKKVARGDTTTR